MHLVLSHINQVDIRKLYLELGYDSLYQYLTKHLGYAENVAYDRLQAARVLKQEQKAGKALSEESTQQL